ncbi:MAG: HlyC/CorC family transporter [Spirochaetales bacterium]|nr:HlyC/CorC family transporter [Spirochaetales bacterium]
MIFQLLLLAGLVLLSGFFSGSETAFTSLSAVQVHRLEESGGKRGRLVARLTARPDALLTTILVGNNLVNVAAAAIATQLAIRWLGNTAVGVVTGVMTLVILVFGEVTPKHLAIQNNEWVCLHAARAITALSYVFRPVVVVIGALSRLFTRLFRSGRRAPVTLQDILRTIHVAETLGVLEPYEKEMVAKVFRLNDVSLRTIMTHRTEVFSLAQDRTLGEVVDQIIARGFSRIPVYDRDPENITGIVLARDVLRELRHGRLNTPLRQLMMPPIVAPEWKKADEMLVEFRRKQLNIAVVLDEYSGLAGIVTLEDIVEEIFGELYDEREPREQARISYLGPERGYLVMADTPIWEIQDRLSIRLPEGWRDETFGAYLADRLGHIPARGEEVQLAGGKVIVERTRANRMVSCRFLLPEAPGAQRGG